MLRLLLIILIFGCGLPKTKAERNIDPQINSYFELWERDTGIPTATIKTALFTNFTNGAAGSCNMVYKIVKVDIKSWQYLTHYQKIILIYHELAHCLLHKDHNDEMRDDGCPASLLNSTLFTERETERCFIPNYKRYINEIIGI